MKKTTIAVILLICAFVLFAGCDQKSKDKTELGNALVGHWQNKSGDSLYFSRDRMTVVTAGNNYQTTYRVVHADADGGTIALRVGKVIKNDKFNMTSNELSLSLERDGKILNTISAMTFTSLDSDFSKVDDKESP